MPNPPARGRRFFSASDEEIMAGRTTDVYFARTMDILRSKGKMKETALAEFTVGALPRGWPWAVMCGVEEVLRLFEGKDVSIHGLPEGTVFRPRSFSGIRIPVMTIEGPYSEYCVYETPALGFLCHSTGVATMSAHTRIAAKGKVLLSFGVRRMHPAISGARWERIETSLSAISSSATFTRCWAFLRLPFSMRRLDPPISRHGRASRGNWRLRT